MTYVAATRSGTKPSTDLIALSPHRRRRQIPSAVRAEALPTPKHPPTLNSVNPHHPMAARSASTHTGLTLLGCVSLVALGWLSEESRAESPTVAVVRVAPEPGARRQLAAYQVTEVSAADSAQPDDGLPLDLPTLEEFAEQPYLVPAFEQAVTTVSGQQSTVGRSPAAVFVVTSEMIRRSGATSVPEVLRTVPGLQVARINSSQWAITSRGFNTNIAGLFATNNKLLVLIDGRTVYTPYFNGTYWDVQDLLLDDVERIEVIRGPGATIWGANAVNGVVNIITKRAADTQGTLVKAGGGTEESGFAAARVGKQAGENVHYRVYGKWFERDFSFHGGGRRVDDWRQGRVGFRWDWTPNCCDTVTFQGDGYLGQSGFHNSRIGAPDDEQLIGGNLLTRWTHHISDDHDWSVQFYHDRANRDNNIGYQNQRIGTYDVDLRHHLQLDARHNLVWGVGYRWVHDRIDPLGAPPVVFLDPSSRAYATASAMFQDEITLVEDAWFLTLGTKLQHNDFSGFEVQPSVRLLWTPESTWAAWGSVSRAVRTPSRVEHDLRVAIGGGPPLIAMTRDFESEELIAYELGYRSQPVERFSYDVALFFNQYENLASFRLDPPFVNTNDNRGAGYGLELSSNLELTEDWRLTGWYSWLQLQIHPGPLSVSGARGQEVEGSSPHNQVFLMSSHDLRDDVEFDVIGRYVDNLPFQNVPRYTSLDLRLAWQATRATEVVVAGQNLLDSHHPEFGGGWEIQRGVYGMVRCEY